VRPARIFVGLLLKKQSNKEHKRMFSMRAKMISVGLLGTAALLPLDVAKADQVGHASWYALHSRTASGEQMNPSELTAAHRSLPFGTKVVVENLSNGRSVIVRINDRGPFVGGRIIDLSKAAAQSIGMLGTGTVKVRVVTSGSNALAALGNAAAKVKNGTTLAAVGTADLTPSKSRANLKAVAERRPGSHAKAVASLRYAKTRVASRGHGRSRAVAWKSSSKARYAKSQSRYGKAIALSVERPSHVSKRAARLAAKASAERMAARSFGSRGHHAKTASAWGKSSKRRAS
jgi:rare lipoprotein A